MTDTEWKEIENYVKGAARQTVIDILVLENPPEESSAAQDKKKGTKHRWERELIRQGLERYRTEPPDSNIRKGINWLLRKHATFQKCLAGPQLEHFKKRHNALVLRYIITTPMNRNQIGKRLETSAYELIEQGINELAQIFFESGE